MKKPIYILAFILLHQMVIQAQDSNRILASITVDSWENPNFSGARVSCIDLSDNVSTTYWTAFGKCNINLKPKTFYRFDFYHAGFYSKSVEVQTGVPSKESGNAHQVIIEILLKKNCDQDSTLHIIMDEPIGRIKFDKGSKDFQYDYDFTYKMGMKYEEIRKDRCTKAEEQRKEAKRIADELEKARKLAEKLAADKAEQQLQAAEKAHIDSLNALLQAQEEEKFIEIEKKKLEREIVAQKQKDEEERFRKEREEKEAIEQQLAMEKAEAKKREPKFDENQAVIHIWPRHSWPSELANSILEPEYKTGPIGTFSYSLTEGRTDFYIDDATELRNKFPAEFAKAFPNWDYIVETNMRYKGSQ